MLDKVVSTESDLRILPSSKLDAAAFARLDERTSQTVSNTHKQGY